MDRGMPDVEGSARVLSVSDEHITFFPDKPIRVGDRIRVFPAHIDPTVAYHERMHVVRNVTVLTSWDVDLRGW
jgi:D-threonine aldolase